MSEDILNNLKPGEKVADIQEYYWGTNGHLLVYKVTIYSCIRKMFLLFGRPIIEQYNFPFFFETKEFAEEYISCYDKFVVYKDRFNFTFTLVIKDKLVDNEITQKYHYNLVSAVNNHYSPVSEDRILCKDGVWNGYVNYGSSVHPFKRQTIYYTEIFKKEEAAAKEGTIGETFSYKLCNINDGK